MIQLFRITTDPNAPRLRLANPSAFDESLMRFDGKEKWTHSPYRPFDVIAEPCDGGHQFYNLAPGVLAGPHAGLCECEDMYYATGATERLFLLAGETEFIAINPTGFLSAPADGSAPYPVDRYYVPIFRIQGLDPLDLFCSTGFEVPLNEFKNVYDHHGFQGLIFEEIWRSG